MRHLLQPRVLGKSSVAAAVSALACFPRLFLWTDQPAPIWHLEAVIFLCGIILWGFVFAWHERYTGLPVWVLKPGAKPFLLVTGIGLLAAMAFHLWLDPSLRKIMPEEYPTDLKYWLAAVLFSLSLTQLFLTFAPFAWLMRLLNRRWLAIWLTALFGAVVLALKFQSRSSSMSPPLLAVMLVGRVLVGLLTVLFYLRGGMLLASWWTLLVETRYLLDLNDRS